MLNLSTEFRNEMYRDNRNFLVYLDMTLTDGTILHLTNEDIWNNTFKISDSTSASNTFTIGAAVTGKLNVTINNIYDKFSEYDFDNAIVIAYIGMQLSETLEKVRIGTYIVDTPSYDGSTISLTCLDYMCKFDKTYSNSTLTYPATLNEILADACRCCGVTLVSATFDNYNYSVAERPTDDALTFSDVVACVAQIACKFAKIDTYGRLKLDWYDMNVLDANEIDGGSFDTKTPYETGDSKDGGNFTDYSSGDNVDGGLFTDIYHHIYSTKSFNMSTDDVIITGIKVTEDFEETETNKQQTVLAGQEGYVISISGNILIQSGKASEVASYIYGKIGGMRFRPLKVEALTDPSIEAGDTAYVTDRKQQTYKAFISNRTFTLGGTETISCDSESPLKNSSKSFSALSKALVKERQEQERTMCSYELAVKQLTDLMTQAFGVFKTAEEQTDGSTIYYLHNKPTLASSDTVWKMTADAMAVSVDGGKTWTAGIDSSGNAVVNVLNAIGVNADWIKGGSLEVGGTDRGKNGNIVVKDASGKVLITMNNAGMTLDPSVKIAWTNVSGTDNIATLDEIPTNSQITEITKNTIKTSQLSADQIYGGTLKLGGNNNVNGVLKVYDANGNEVGTISNSLFSVGSSNSEKMDLENGRLYFYFQDAQKGRINVNETIDGKNVLSIQGKEGLALAASDFYIGDYLGTDNYYHIPGSSRIPIITKIKYSSDGKASYDWTSVEIQHGLIWTEIYADLVVKS